MASDERAGQPVTPDNDPPPIPQFFSPNDLPDWLQPSDTHAHAKRGDHSRARAAWASADAVPTAGDADAFVSAASATWSVRSPSVPKHPRRKLGRFRGTTATRMIVLIAAMPSCITR